MNRLLRLNRDGAAWNSLGFQDLEQEEIMRSLQPPSEICAEENRARIANRRFSDILPPRRITLGLFEYNRPEHRVLTPSGDQPSPRIVSAPLLRKVNSYLSDTVTIVPPHSLNKQDPFDPLKTCTIRPSWNTHSSASGIPESPTHPYPSTKATTDKASFVMKGAHIPPYRPKLHSYHPPASHPSGLTPAAPSSYLPREDSASSLLSLEARDSSIRIVKPDLTLSPPQRTKDKNTKDEGQAGKSQQATMYGNRQNGQKSHSNAEESSYRLKAVGGHSRSHSRSGSQHKQSFDTAEGYGRTRDHSTSSSISKTDPSTWNNSVRSKSTDRGRTMQRRYEFIDSDGTTHEELTPVQETAKNQDDSNNNSNRSAGNVGRESDMTTMTDLMQQCVEHPPPHLPARRNRQQHQADGAVGTSATQLSLPQPQPKHRPLPLNLKNPAYIGMVNRNANRYNIEHVAIKSSKAEQFDFYSPSTGSLAYDDTEDMPNISPLNIPKCNEMGGTSSLQAYTEWRENLNPIHTASQGTIHVTIPTLQEDTFMAQKNIDEDRRQVADYHQDTPVINHVRSRSALGIREDGDKEGYHRQFSGASVYTASEYSAAMPAGLGSGIVRSATINDVPRRDRQYSGGSESKASENGVAMNNLVPRIEMVTPPSPYTPLTAFIMQASGAPAGVEQGAKTLFGEHGWLEDTAAVGAKKPKIEKPGRFMESLKRKAREIADSTSFKPARHSRTSSVNRINISLDAREQSLLYCELEYNLNNALDAYFKAQLNSGRLDASKLSRISDAWAQKGRPKVVGFRYDLETQVELITAHINDFRFYGPVQAEGPAAVAGLLHAMKTNARYMRIRTFCQPDSVIAKHVLDSQSFLRLLGSPEPLQRPLEEVAQFFKVAVDRRKIMAEAPPVRQARGRFISDGSGRVISNGSGQRVRFQDDGERHQPRAEMPKASKSRPDARDGNDEA